MLPGQSFFILQPDALFFLVFADVLFYALQLEYIFILSYKALQMPMIIKIHKFTTLTKFFRNSEKVKLERFHTWFSKTCFEKNLWKHAMFLQDMP